MNPSLYDSTKGKGLASKQEMERLPLTTLTMKIRAFLYAERITGQEMTQEIQAHGLVCHLKKRMFLKFCMQVVLRHTDHLLVFCNYYFQKSKLSHLKESLCYYS